MKQKTDVVLEDMLLVTAVPDVLLSTFIIIDDLIDSLSSCFPLQLQKENKIRPKDAMTKKKFFIRGQN